MTTLPECNEEYNDIAYWNERYANESSFDWCKSYEAFQKLVHLHVKKTDKILILGCGNSTLSEELFRDGFEHVVNVDYSPVVIANMREKNDATRAMTWHVMDIQSMTFPDASFDVVLEKATLDALLVGEKDPWKLSLAAEATMDNILGKVSKMLRPNGRLISITFAQPHFRKRVYAKLKYDWDLYMETFGDMFHFFFYVMTKGKSLSQELTELSPTPTAPIVPLLAEENENYLSNMDIEL